MEMEKILLGMAWRGEDIAFLHFKFLVWVRMLSGLMPSIFLFSFAQGLPCHPGTGSV